MPSSSPEFITLCNIVHPDGREFVFSIKGRPFSMLASKKLSIPTTSLIDYSLVSELGLKMSDLQCSKFTFGGQRFRVLGKIVQTVQTIKDGVVSGTVHLRANVVEGLRNVFDSHSIAGKKFSEMLSGKVSHTKPPTTPQSTPPCSTRSSKTSSPTPTVTKVKRSPPGFPAVPQYSGGHKMKVSHAVPTTPRNKPLSGHVRRLQLKPGEDQDQYRTWHQGRVLEIDHDIEDAPSLALVKVLRQRDDPLKYMHGANFREYCRFPGLNLEVADAVLYHGVDSTPGLPYEDSMSRIMMVYNEREVEALESLGVEFPEQKTCYTLEPMTLADLHCDDIPLP